MGEMSDSKPGSSGRRSAGDSKPGSGGRRSGDSKPRSRIQVVEGSEQGFATTRLDDLVNWARKYSLFQYPFATACCAMEFMALASPRFDIARFGAEAPRFSPRQSDLLWVIGTVSQRQAPVLKRVYDQMAAPRWVIAFGTCASTGGFYDNYATLPGIDQVVPVDIYIPGCPPRPESAIDGLLLLQDKIASGDPRPRILKPRLDPVPRAARLAKALRAAADARPRAASQDSADDFEEEA
jgi:NADH-quinone oxidoreductase subunit B